MVTDIITDGLVTNLGTALNKAKVLGVPIFVDPKNKHIKAMPYLECQYIDKRDRKTRDLFQCLQCRFTAMADYIGAIINIRL